jgi:outer membrane biosynthesis protein TonB
VSALRFQDRDSRLPALIVAAALHIGVLALVSLTPARPPLLPIGSSVPITLVSADQVTDTKPAVQAPVTQAAAAPAPTPAPKAPPEVPAPTPAPPAFTPVSKPAPKPVKPVVQQPSIHAAATPQKAFDFNHLQNIIDNARRNSGSTASSAPRGPARPETAPQARPDAGQGVSVSDLAGLQQLLERLWNPNCDVPGGEAVRLTVKFTVGVNGRLIGSPRAGGAENSGDPVVAAAARRAIDAVRQAEPYAEPYYGQSIVVNFDAKEACAKR